MKINHLGIIPDGNRRWARANNISLEAVYQIFANKIANIVELLPKLEVKELSVYIASKENLTRKPEEIEPVVNSCIDTVSERRFKYQTGMVAPACAPLHSGIQCYERSLVPVEEVASQMQEEGNGELAVMSI